MSALPDIDSLPDDPRFLKQFIKEYLGKFAEDYARLRKFLDDLRRAHFGPRSEKVVAEQLLLHFADLMAPSPPAPASPPTPPQEPQPRKGHGRNPLPSHLPRKRVVLEIPESERLCKHCGKPLRKIGEHGSELLEYTPASFCVHETVCCVYACKDCEGNVVSAEPPEKPIAKGEAGASLIAQVITAKYADHLPLERQSHIYERSGVELSPSTLGDWVAAGADLLRPIVRAMEVDLLTGKKLHTDDTPVPVLDALLNHTRIARLWGYVGDEDHPHNILRYTPNHSNDDAVEFLKAFHGYLQADAYPGYDVVFKDGRILEACCNAHARRKFFEARSTDPINASAAIAWYAELYRIERELKGKSPEERLKTRQERSRPVWERFHTWIEAKQREVLPKSPMGEALQYASNHWVALGRYLEAAILDIDNNVAERLLRGIAVGRKNWMFAGSDKGGERAAICYSIVETCKRHHLDPWEYLRDVLSRISSTPMSQVADLMPHRWKAARDRARSECAAAPAPPAKG